MTFFLTNPTVIVCETFRVADHVAVTDARMKRDRHVAGERPRARANRSKVVPMRASHTSLDKKAHEDNSEFDRKFRW